MERTRTRCQSSRRRIAWLASLAIGAALSSCAVPGSTVGGGSVPLSREQIIKIVASPDRSAADRTNDKRRKPEEMLAFISPTPGMVAFDLSAGGGYTTELLARAVGPTGRVYGQSAPRDLGRAPVSPEGRDYPRVETPPAIVTSPPPVRTSAIAIAERAKSAGLPNMFSVTRPFEDPVPPEIANENLDLVTLMFNYHDLGHLGVDRSKMNRAVFAALKPGGIYVIGDHAGRDGTGISESGTLHRIEEAFLKREVEAVGFRLIAEGEFLRNPNDPRDKNTPDPLQPKDDFVLKFQKPRS